MPKLTVSTPKYRKHRASGQAVVTINSVDHYLGPYGTKASKLQYDRLVCQWLVADRAPKFGLPEHKAGATTIADLINAYRKYCEKRFRRPDGTPTGAIESIKACMKRLRARYGDLPVDDFRPLMLEEFVAFLVKENLSRNYINGCLAKIKTMFRWGVSKELVDARTLERVKSVRAEERGRSEARETEPVLPVDDAIVDMTLPKLPTMVADMVRLQRLTGARPGEICGMKASELEDHQGVILYRPEFHKTQHKQKARVIVIGPKGAEIVKKYLAYGDKYIFSPRRSVAMEMAKRGICRVPPKTVKDAYTNDSYLRAIRRVCEEIFKDDKSKWWRPNQLRHSLATEVRAAEKSLESVAAVLGHSNVETSQIYAERNLGLAIDVMRRLG